MIQDAIYNTPIPFPPIFKDKIWGGQKLRTVLSKDIPENSLIGESWELSGFGSDLSTVSHEEFGAYTIQEILQNNPSKLLGKIKNPGYFPLLYKFIDASSMLSVQVHPDDDQAIRNGWGSNGKTECWYIADVIPGGEIIVGFKEGTTLAEVEACIRNNSLDKILNRIPIARGDLLFIPARTVHAILGGTLLYEIQETSDTTFRLYDWGRVDKNGASRQLHIKESLQVLDTAYHERHKIPPVTCDESKEVVHLFRAACNYFTVEEYYFKNDSQTVLTPKISFMAVTVIDGSCIFHTGLHERFSLSKGRTALLPAECTCKPIRVDGKKQSRFILSSVPDLKKEVIEYLRKRKITDSHIALLGGNPEKNDILSLL